MRPKKRPSHRTEDNGHLCSSCTAISSMLSTGSTLWLCWTVILCFPLCSRPTLECCSTISLAYKYPTKLTNGWMNYSRNELTVIVYMFSCWFIIELNHDHICNLWDSKWAPPSFFKITCYGKEFHHLQITYANH